MVSNPVDRIVIQNNWDHVIKDETGSIWMNYKTPGKLSIKGKIILNKSEKNQKPNPQFETDELEDICVTYSKQKNCLSLEYSLESRRKFIQYYSPQQTFQHKKCLYSIDVSSGGLGILSDSDSKLFIWTTADGTTRRDLIGHCGDVYACCLFPSGVVALSGGADTQLKVWAVDTGLCVATLIGHQKAVSSLAIVEKGRNILSGSKDGTVRLWDVGTQKCLHVFESAGICNSVALLSNPAVSSSASNNGDREIGTAGKVLLVGRESSEFEALSLNCRTRICLLKTSDSVNCCTSVSGNIIAIGCQDSSLYLLDIRNPNKFLSESHHSRSAFLAMRAKDESSIYLASADGSCFTHNVKTSNNPVKDKNLEHTVEYTGSNCEPINAMAFDGQHLYTCCRDAQVRKYALV